MENAKSYFADKTNSILVVAFTLVTFLNATMERTVRTQGPLCETRRMFMDNA